MSSCRCVHRLRVNLAPAALVSWGLAALAGGCQGTAPKADETYEAMMSGTIAYPFAEPSKTLGTSPSEEKFIIKSTVGDREYEIAIPGAARDFDVQVPLAEMGETDQDVLGGRKPRKLASPVATDQEMTAALPRLDKARGADTALMDSAFGVGKPEGPGQAPSYTLGIAKINELFKRREFEFALVEINNMLAYYANSPQLYKMKGTLLVKMRNLPLAELAWIKAVQLDPKDRVMRAALERLQRRIAAQGAAAAGTVGPPQPAPQAIGTAPTQPASVIGH